jgi:deoxyribonuclease V
MMIPKCHPWPSTYAEAVAIQTALRRRLVRTGALSHPTLVAGADVAYSRSTDRVYAAVVLLRLPEMAIVETVTRSGRSPFPYVPGLLTFREGPVLLSAFKGLKLRPDAVIFDGQGYAHPRRMGLASHMGILLGIPSVGCAKSRLIGEHDEPGPCVGDWTPLLDQGRLIGRVVRTRTGVKPVFLSVGHLLGLAAATRLVLACLRGCRLPEPTRRAHQIVTAFRKQPF